MTFKLHLIEHIDKERQRTHSGRNYLQTTPTSDYYPDSLQIRCLSDVENSHITLFRKPVPRPGASSNRSCAAVFEDRDHHKRIRDGQYFRQCNSQSLEDLWLSVLLEYSNPQMSGIIRDDSV